MTAYILRRLVETLPVILISSILIFLLLRALPGDPALIIAGPDATPTVLAAVRRDLGLDQSLPVQYATWLGRVLRGDFGTSFANKYPVADLIGSTFPATIQLAVVSMVIALVIAFPTGIISALRERSAIDYTISTYNTLALGIPNFWLGLLFMILFALLLGWLPAGGRAMGQAGTLDQARFLVLPAFTLSFQVSAVISRFIKASLLEALAEDYLRTARAKGLREWAVVVRHALPNALVPVVTVIALQFGRLLGGVVIIETVFAWPGMGRLMVQAISNRDYMVVQGCLLTLVAIFIAINLITDVLYVFLDPRIRLGAGRV